ncbi:hypothetical protein BDU57DRAFT_512914 [Ampelomyces quisqualis]|uniref:Uncharacterized protein n=1 Tax=Ampelomyces quisqualis TaxID=50730 RepID=A0A6A5QWH6_AMPQU|nr:hypothetical protein BDU57DRAFT_512914 [Ampelomyces quisqualis]
MECGIYNTAYYFNQFDGVYSPPLRNPVPDSTWTVNLCRLRHERDILENGLANCVTYLHVLRKKQARMERLLALDPLPSRKRRKKIQQRKRELDMEIRNKQRDEEAFLSSLQTCKANIYVAEGLLYSPTEPSLTIADCTSSTTQLSSEESAPTEISWNGWTEGAVQSPFEKKRINPFFTHDVAPDELEELDEEIVVVQNSRRPLALIRGLEDIAVFPAPPNTAHSQFRHSPLSPEAPIFEPNSSDVIHTDEPKVLSGHIKHSEDTASARRCTEAGICQALQNLSIYDSSGSFHGSNQTWCQNTPQGSPRKNTARKGPPRRRANSL